MGIWCRGLFRAKGNVFGETLRVYVNALILFVGLGRVFSLSSISPTVSTPCLLHVTSFTPISSRMPETNSKVSFIN